MSDIPRKSLETFAFKILSQGASALTGILLARVLGPSGKGAFAYVTSLFAVFLALNSGQAAAVAWQYGRLRRPSESVFAAMLRILAFGGIPLALILAAIGLAVPGQTYLIAAAVALPFAFFSQMALGFYLADGKVRVFNIQILIGSFGFLLVATLALLVLHLGIAGALASWVCASIGTALYTMLMLRPYTGIRDNTSADIKEQAAFGLRASTNSLVAFLNYQIDVFIIRFALGVGSLGIYSIAIGAGELMWQLTNPLRQSAFGRINSSSRAESAALTAKCVRHALAIITTGCVLLYFLGPYLIPIVYGRAFEGAGTALRLLIPGIIAYSVTPFFAVFFTQQLGRPMIMFRILSISTIVCAVITLAMVHRLGIAAGAIGTSVSYCTAFVASVIIFKRQTGISAKTLFGFGPKDLQPYTILLKSIWNRALGFALGRRV